LLVLSEAKQEKTEPSSETPPSNVQSEVNTKQNLLVTSMVRKPLETFDRHHIKSNEQHDCNVNNTEPRMEGPRTLTYLCFSQGNILMVVALDEEEPSISQNVTKLTGGICKDRGSG